MEEEKSHVSMAQKICIVTGKPFDSGEILLDTRLKKSLKRHTVTGYGISPEVQKILDEDNIALVGIVPEKSNNLGNIVNPEDMYRSGKIAYIKNYAFKHIFKQEPPKGKILFIATEIINQLEERIYNEVN